MSFHLMREVQLLKKQILELGAVVENTVFQAVDTVVRGDLKIARGIMEADAEIDRTEVEIEEDCLKILALYQPVAIDLRFIITALKINSDLERIGDLAVNIAEQALFLDATRCGVMPFDLAGMAGKAEAMLKRSLDALVNLDGEEARRVCAADDDVDQLYREAFLLVKQTVRARPESLDMMMTLLMVARQLERIADHATNIAEDVIYMIAGHIVRHQNIAERA